MTTQTETNKLEADLVSYQQHLQRLIVTGVDVRRELANAIIKEGHQALRWDGPAQAIAEGVFAAELLELINEHADATAKLTAVQEFRAHHIGRIISGAYNTRGGGHASRATRNAEFDAITHLLNGMKLRLALSKS